MHVARFLLLLLAALTVKPISTASEMVPSNILQRVFCIRFENSDTFGTAFTIEEDGNQYLVTARHVLPANIAGGVVELLRNSSWEKVTFTTVPVEPANVDIIVLKPARQISPFLEVELGFKNSFLSQPIFFVGYPYFLSIDGAAANGGYPIPFVKHGIIAGFGAKNGPFFLDAINNVGFSGGPVVRVENLNRPAIIGVISGYRPEEVTVRRAGNATDSTVSVNTGITVAYSIDYALEAIRQNARRSATAEVPKN